MAVNCVTSVIPVSEVDLNYQEEMNLDQFQAELKL